MTLKPSSIEAGNSNAFSRLPLARGDAAGALSGVTMSEGRAVLLVSMLIDCVIVFAIESVAACAISAGVVACFLSEIVSDAVPAAGLAMVLAAAGLGLGLGLAAGWGTAGAGAGATGETGAATGAGNINGVNGVADVTGGSTTRATKAAGLLADSKICPAAGDNNSQCTKATAASRASSVLRGITLAVVGFLRGSVVTAA